MDAHHSRAENAFMVDEAMDAPPIVLFDERRMHIRAYNYWASLLGGRSLPSIEDLNPAEIEDFGSHSVLLDFTGGVDDPSIVFLGSALAAQCDIGTSVRQTSEIPPRTLLSRLTDHYLQIIANAAPIGFEAEFTNQRGDEIMYRGIMMPFSTDDESIDFVYGVINWKEVANDILTDCIIAEAEAASPSKINALPKSAIWENDPSSLDFPVLDGVDEGDDHEEYELDHALELTPEMVDASAAETALGDSLHRARTAAAAAQASEGRTRHALYRAIGLAHAFACVARARPQDYAELLADASIEVQKRSPLAALVKLVFGADYDKTRLAEFACAIGFALDGEMAPGALVDHLHAQPGGLKGLVASVRAAKRGAVAKTPKTGGVRARRKLVQAATIEAAQVSVDDEGLAVVIVRREEDGRLAMVAALAHEDPLVFRVFQHAAKSL